MNTIKKMLLLLAAFSSFSLYAESGRELHILSTGDVHGNWFSESFVKDGKINNSLEAVKCKVDSFRTAYGRDNVLLLDAGDGLQGTNAPYYYNYVAVSEPHLYPRLAKYIGYDAITVGNHDIETGHKVYDRVALELENAGIPWLYANALKADGSCYFKEYAVFERGGMKVLVIGFGNANIRSWLQPQLWEGIDFKSIVSMAGEVVARLKAEVKPQLTVLLLHSGTGKGNGQHLENQALDVYRSVKGVDLVIGGHDHKPYALLENGCAYVDGGAKSSSMGHAVACAGGKEGHRIVRAETLNLDKSKVDPLMRKHFNKEFNLVSDFSNRKIGSLDTDLLSRDGYRGMSDYTNLVHTVQLKVSGAPISFCAPLNYDGKVKKGELIYNDLFTIYPFENQLFVVKMTGKEIKKYLEFSYDNWIVTPGSHVLKIKNTPEPRTGSFKWSFVGWSYNFDSAAGIKYSVDVTKPAGSRVKILSMADGSSFSEDAWYEVATSSYRANGGGDLMVKGAGIPAEELQGRVVRRYEEMRELIYKFIGDNGGLKKEAFGKSELLGSWSFEPKAVVEPLMEADMELIF